MEVGFGDLKIGEFVMDIFEFKREQQRLAGRVELQDGFSTVKTVGGAVCVVVGKNLLACVVVCELPSFTVVDKAFYLLHDPLPFQTGFSAYREMPAIIEAYNQLSIEPDVLFVEGEGVAHPRAFGIASHLGVVLRVPTIGVMDRLQYGNVVEGKILVFGSERGFEVVTREHAKPVYVSPGHLVSLAMARELVLQTMKQPHKMPEPIHLAHKLARKMREEK